MSVAVVDEIISKAMKQPTKERAQIAEALIASLDSPPEKDVEAAWQKEINKRLKEIDSGTVECVPWEEVRDRLFRNSNEKR